ncbi:hypothetical protein DAEQUDRAFT_245449 [Daedalea quercina L-15889]|uniref:Uncharacterized protein n=1 Tax=Daedalea quercina L-15889 TaxID=1314783 RepID=A0A165QLB5_9APHY|nr:hypothetical protein DAEQUDRAFT_245449 [Daedalea quercina L-15889]
MRLRMEVRPIYRLEAPERQADLGRTLSLSILLPSCLALNLNFHDQTRPLHPLLSSARWVCVGTGGTAGLYRVSGPRLSERSNSGLEAPVSPLSTCPGHPQWHRPHSVLSAVFLLMLCCVVTTHVVFKAVDEESRTWPYMLNYVAVDIPPSPPVFVNWPTANLGAWFLMTATCSGLIQITHIQFLTLLFPSKLEKRLIYALLVPLAAIAAVMQMLRVIARHRLLESIIAVQNICNATLSLLFTAALFIWGFLVNRRNAWRMDGGTAAFGLGALTLAPMSTAIAFLYVPTKEQYTWMPQLMWAIILWQSFLGWWWWVGAGMGVGEVDDLLSREEKRKQKRALRSTRRRQHRERAETMLRGVTGALGLRRNSSEERTSLVRTDTGATSSTVLSSVASHAPVRQLYDWFLYWRREHLRAARAQAVECSERRQRGRAGKGSLMGWGLGSFNIQRAGKQEQETRSDGHTVVASESDPDTSADSWGRIVVDDADSRKLSGIEVVSRQAEVHVRHTARDEEPSSPKLPAKVADMRIPTESPPSLWWLGPLRRWRLQDSTVY